MLIVKLNSFLHIKDSDTELSPANHQQTTLKVIRDSGIIM